MTKKKKQFFFLFVIHWQQREEKWLYRFYLFKALLLLYAPQKKKRLSLWQNWRGRVSFSSSFIDDKSKRVGLAPLLIAIFFLSFLSEKKSSISWQKVRAEFLYRCCATTKMRESFVVTSGESKKLCLLFPVVMIHSKDLLHCQKRTKMKEFYIIKQSYQLLYLLFSSCVFVIFGCKHVFAVCFTNNLVVKCVPL